MKDKYLGPYQSLREYLDALEHFGYILHIDDINQDKYEATALMYRIIEKHNVREAPVLFFDKIYSKNNIFKQSSVGNLFGKWDLEALAIGILPDESSSQQNYQLALDKLEQHIDKDGKWPIINPVTIDASEAPCKENILEGEAVNLFNFPFLQTNPADNGCYINTGSVILEDDELGRNVGTYRCQINNSKRIGINPQVNQDGWKFLQKLKAQGRAAAQVAIVIGTDPITFSTTVDPHLGTPIMKIGLISLSTSGISNFVNCSVLGK